MSSISTYEQTGTAASGSTAVTLADATGVAVGQSVAGPGIASGTEVGAISSTSLTLTKATTGVLGWFTQTGSTMAPFTATATWWAYYSSLTLASADPNIAVGMAVTGAGIGANCRVKHVSAKTVQLTVPNTGYSANSGTTITFSSFVATLTAACDAKISAGQIVSGTGVADGTAVESCTGTTLTLSKPATSAMTSATLTFQRYTLTASASSGSTTVTLASSSLYSATGQVVTGM